MRNEKTTKLVFPNAFSLNNNNGNTIFIMFSFINNIFFDNVDKFDPRSYS